jgi:hypothetical protein
MMDQASGHMNGWLGGGMWLWTVIGMLIIILLIGAIIRFSGK